MDDWELQISEVDETSRDMEERKIEAIFWLFHESTEPWSAWWVTSHLGIDLKHIRHVVKNRPAQLRSALQYRQRTKAA